MPKSLCIKIGDVYDGNVEKIREEICSRVEKFEIDSAIRGMAVHFNECLEYNKRRREKEEYQNLTYSGRTKTVDEETGRQNIRSSRPKYGS
jgi:hypothetical protein